MTEEEKWKARMERAAAYDFKAHCRALLPIATDKLAAALERGKMSPGDIIRAQESLRDTVHGKPAQVLTAGAGDGGPLAGTFVAILAQLNGAKVEKLAEPVNVEVRQVANGNGSNGHAAGNGANGNGAHEKL